MRINIMALGDVGQNLALGLKLLGRGTIDEIGIYDINKKQINRLEMELGQIALPLYEESNLPHVVAINEDGLLECDVLVFCASKGVPSLDSEGDVRLAQLEGNSALIRSLGSKIKKNLDRAPELILVMSDPVDQLCNVLLESSGLAPERIRGLGLGVMNARAFYYAERYEKYSSYLEDGRVFGPHGEGLVVANSISNYDDEISVELTELVKTSNIRVRELGYKPFIAPAISSGAFSILEMLKGNWTYGSVYLVNPFGLEGSSYFGMLSRKTENGWELEEANLPDELTERLKKSFEEGLNI